MDLSNVSDADLIAAINAGNATQSPGASGSGQTGISTELNAIHQIESGGASDSRADIVNPASGARGSMQVMGNTARDPGFGVAPSNGTPQDDARMGRDYYTALRQKYGSPDIAAIAYNWGPGNADKWLANGGDLSKLPDETLKYVSNFQQRLVSDTRNGQTSANQNASNVPGDAGTSTSPKPFFPGISDVQIPQPAASNASDSNFAVKFGAGVGEGFGKTAVGAQALVGKGLQAIGLDSAGNALVNDAQTGAMNLTQQAQGAAGNSGWRTAGNIAGAAAPLVVLGPELAPQIAGGALYGGSQAALNNTSILPGAVEGAGMGALGFGAGKAIEAGAPAITGFIAPKIATAKDWVSDAFRGGEGAATSGIAGQYGASELDPLIANLRVNSNEIIPGSLPTAAEAAGDTRMVATQRQLQNTAEGQVAFTDRANANNAARWQASDDAVGSNLSSDTDAFTQHQAARVAAGQTELPPISDTQAAIMQTPAYIQAMKTASNLADNRGSTAFADQQVPLRAALSQNIDDIAGTPQTIDALRAARGAGADETFRAANISVPVDNPQFQTLLNKPAFQSAMKTAQKMSDDLSEGPLYTNSANRAMANLGGAKAAPTQYVAGRGLLYAKGVLDDQIGRALQLGENAKARPLMAVRGDLLDVMDGASPEYAAARAQFQAASGPIDAQAALQKRLTGAVDPVSGGVSPNRLRQAINSVNAEQLKPGIREADKVSPEMLDQLNTLAQRAKLTPSDMTGLQGEGQEYLRQGLQDRARSSADSIMSREANQAHADFNQYLRANSKNYDQFFNEQATTGANLASRQRLADGLDKLSLGSHNTAGDPIITLPGARGLAAGKLPLTGDAKAYVDSLISDLSRASAANNSLGAAGSQTIANANLGGGLLGRFMRTASNQLPIGGAVTHGATGYVVGQIAKEAIARASAKTEKAAIDLLLNPKKLAQALEDFKGQTAARKAYVETLKQKAAGSGKAGMRAVQIYEAQRTQNQGNRRSKNN